MKNLFCFKIIICLLLFSCKEKFEYTLPKADKDNGGLYLPTGFSALVVSDSIGPARHLAINENNDIYVKLGITGGVDGSVALRDNNNDGKADINQRFGNYTNDGKFATEMRIRNGYLYFSSELAVYRIKLDGKELIPKGKPELLLLDEHPVQWHNAKSLAFDNKGGMYVTFSAPTNVCEDWNSTVGESSANIMSYYPCPELKEHAGIWKFSDSKLDQRQRDGKLYATGLRSVVGITWNEKDNSLYAMQHGRDYLYGHSPSNYTPWINTTTPGEEFVKIKEGDNFGWPYGYYDQEKKKRMLAPEFGGDGKTDVKGFKDPLMAFPAHWAPNDLLFYKGDQFPERYKDGAFIAFHGSTNRAPYPQGGYIVAFVPFIDGKPSEKWEVFADGFAAKDTIEKMEEASYRPCGLAEGPDGSLYICDSKKGKIWRILYSGDKSKFSDTNLAQMEARKNLSHIKKPDEYKDNLSLRKPINGKEIYNAHCYSCHQANGEGQEKKYPSLVNSPIVNGPNQALIKSIVKGQRGVSIIPVNLYNHAMPSYQWMTNEQLVEVINYVKSNFKNKGGKISEKEIEEIRKNN